MNSNRILSQNARFHTVSFKIPRKFNCIFDKSWRILQKSHRNSQEIHKKMIQYDSECVPFLQWCLPILGYRWDGFKKVRRQVCRRISRRFQELGLSDFASYQKYLEDRIPDAGVLRTFQKGQIAGMAKSFGKPDTIAAGIPEHPENEWAVLDEMCHVTISRFYRNKGVFETIQDEILPEIINRAISKGRDEVRIWSAGCCSGEEPYTLNILILLWLRHFSGSKEHFPHVNIIATEKHGYLLERAKEAVYSYSSIKDLPEETRVEAFAEENGRFRLMEEYRENVDFRLQDIRKEIPEGTFDLILCRNLVFTYFAEDFQREFLDTIRRILCPGGRLIIGAHEKLPGNIAVEGIKSIYRFNQPLPI